MKTNGDGYFPFDYLFLEEKNNEFKTQNLEIFLDVVKLFKKNQRGKAVKKLHGD